MTDVTSPATVFPKAYATQVIGSRTTFCLDADLVNPPANVLAMPNCPVVVLNTGPFSVSPKFFGMHVQYRVNDPLSGITANTIRSHDCSGGIARWQFIQPTSGTWSWTGLDSWVNAHCAAGRDIVFTLFGTPAWASARASEDNAYTVGGVTSNRGIAAEPSDMTKWDAYCTAVATRYLGKIKYYEVWNEVNYHNDGTGPGANVDCFFTGTFAKLSEMVRRANQAIKAVDPTAKIICPPVQGWTTVSGTSDSYFTGMMAASDGASGTMVQWVDIVGVHLYNPGNDARNMSGIIDRVIASKATAGVSGLETWDTESSPYSPTPNAMTDPVIYQVMARNMITMAAKGVARTIYYQYDHPTQGIMNRGAAAYRENIVAILKSGTVLGASKLTDGRVAYSTSNGVFVI